MFFAYSRRLLQDVVYSAHLYWVDWDLEMTAECVVGGDSETVAWLPLERGTFLSSPYSPQAFFSLCWILLLPHWVWELYRWWTPRSAQGLCEWHHWERFHISESPRLSPTSSPLCMIQRPGCHRDFNVPFFFFFVIPSFGTLSAFIRLVWHIKTLTCHSC